MRDRPGDATLVAGCAPTVAAVEVDSSDGRDGPLERTEVRVAGRCVALYDGDERSSVAGIAN